MGVRLEISARLISWPDQCACCLGRTNATYEAAYTRETGKRIIRSDERSWKIPYCTDCRAHVEAPRGDGSLTAIKAYMVLACGLLLGAGIAVTGSCCCGPVLFTPVKPDAENSKAALAGYVAGAAGSTALGLGVVAGAYYWFRQLAAEARRRRRMAMDRVMALVSKSCCTPDEAVDYEGWYGTVHTFWFANDDFAEAVARANPGKVVGTEPDADR